VASLTRKNIFFCWLKTRTSCGYQRRLQECFHMCVVQAYAILSCTLLEHLNISLCSSWLLPNVTKFIGMCVSSWLS